MARLAELAAVWVAGVLAFAALVWVAWWRAQIPEEAEGG